MPKPNFCHMQSNGFGKAITSSVRIDWLQPGVGEQPSRLRLAFCEFKPTLAEPLIVRFCVGDEESVLGFVWMLLINYKGAIHTRAETEIGFCWVQSCRLWKSIGTFVTHHRDADWLTLDISPHRHPIRTFMVSLQPI